MSNQLAQIHRRAPPRAPYANGVGGTCGVVRRIAEISFLRYRGVPDGVQP